MREVAVERYLVRCVKSHGGICEKFTSPVRSGVPDRLVTWPDGRMQLVETKAPGGVLSVPQARDHARRRKLGVLVRVVWSKDCVDTFILFNA